MNFMNFLTKFLTFFFHEFFDEFFDKHFDDFWQIFLTNFFDEQIFLMNLLLMTNFLTIFSTYRLFRNERER